ncbi:outer membrane beta-barrel protein [Steroidobacter sp. S1-65]|uniref:Outer membrane beta-barrel protein n=1 Tax=Steroidobacter gossypii TaxID=2805490 RepID=A0ABS1WQD5_9GAMM|nr:outer membrane beta-barrel protein [Steroidobacter gossypii]MBM0103187.1 outer membrane beta-barrel protein [Steroidobacter gossypii]
MTAKVILRRNTLCLAAAGTALCHVSPAVLAAQPDEKEEEHFYIADQYVYDDNLFREAESEDLDTIPADPNDPNSVPREVSRKDYVNRITVGLGNDFHMGQQTLRLKGRVFDARYQDNDYLDFTGGDATAQFDFRALTVFSGRLSGGYGRTLADFANTRGTERDLIETINYNALVRYEIGPRWSISASGGRAETEHDLDTRENENVEADIGRISLDYATPSFHSFGVEYRYIDAKFPNAVIAPGASASESDYEENAALARFTYTATVRTQFRVSAGYVERERPANPEGRYSGDTWRAEIDWKPREKFSTLFSAWSELKAYTDVESDYFISDGFSLAPTWSPTEKLSLALSVAYEDQEYLNTRDLELVGEQRNDDVLSGLFTFTYKPRDQLAIELSYRGSDRDSNRINRRYDAQTAGVSVRWSVF